MTHNFYRTSAKAVSRSPLCPQRTGDFVPATSNPALEPRHSPRMPSQTLFDSGCSGKLPFPMVRHCTRSAPHRKGSHQKFLAWLSSSELKREREQAAPYRMELVRGQTTLLVREELTSRKHSAMSAISPKHANRGAECPLSGVVST